QVATGIVKLDEGRFELIVKVNVHTGYHLYAHVAEGDPYEATRLHFEFPEGVRAVGELQKPSFKYFNQRGTTAYSGELLFKQVVQGPRVGEVKVTLAYQCCDSQICFPAVTEDYQIKLGD